MSNAAVEVINSQDLSSIYSAYEIVVSNDCVADALTKMNIPFKRIFGSNEFFSLWQNLYRLSLRGMNIGGGGNVFTSGEFSALNILRNQFRLGDAPVLFDVGANVGKYTSLLMNVFPKATIHSFEPAKETFSNLQKNTAETSPA